MTTQSFELRSLVTEVCALAVSAGQAILDIYAQDFSVTHKSDLSPLTEADMASHYVLLKGLSQLTPTVPILSEEGESVPFSERRQWQALWLIDPLDGTREFIKRNGEFTVNVSLVCGTTSVLGVVYAPVSGECYFAYQGGGAYKKNNKGETSRLKARHWLGSHVTIAGSRSQRTENFENFIAGFTSYDLITLGSALKSCVIAEGRADVYARFGPTSEWDTAAAQCILEEAGGRVMCLDGRQLAYNQKDSLLNPSFLAVGDVNHLWCNYLPDTLR